MIQQHIIDQILSAARIEEVIGEYVLLKKRGVNYIGLCPFHSEKTPSFTVNPSREIFKCFGCGKAGNVVKFLMEHEKLTYPEALKHLAKKYQITVEEKEESDEDKKARDEISSLYIVLNFASQFYHNYLLNNEEGRNIGLAYLKSRRISDESIKKFQLGFCPSEKNHFSDHALRSGYKKEHLIDAGLSIQYNNQLIDRFRERVVFPINSTSGKTLGFGARTLKSQTKEAKYINSPENKVYNKSKILFGLDLARDSIRKLDFCYLVEGYTDVIALHEAGIYNVVSSSGTSLTTDQIRLIKRYTENIHFIFDGDEAGLKAAMRGIDLCLEEETHIRAIALPAGEDPDSIVKSMQKEEVHAYLEKNSSDFILFKSDILLQGTEKDPLKKSRAIREIVKTIAIIKNQLIRSSYIKELSRKLQIDEEQLYRELNDILISQRNKRSGNIAITQKKESLAPENIIETSSVRSVSGDQEKQLISLLLQYGAYKYNEDQNITDFILDFLDDNTWEDPLMQSIFEDYKQYYHETGNIPSLARYIDHQNQFISQFVGSFAFNSPELSPNWSKKTNMDIKTKPDFIKELKLSLKHFELRKYLNLKKENLKELKEENPDPEELDEKLAIHKLLSEKIQELSQELGIVIL
jgi:DNA primase